jgi:hypothetical protein
MALAILACAAAGCANVRARDVAPGSPVRVEVPPPAAEAFPFAEAAPVAPVAGFRSLGQGLAAGVSFLFPRDEDRDWLDDGYYINVRYLYELTLHVAWEMDTGYYMANNKLAGLVPGQKDVESVPVRLTLQIASDISEYDSKLYAYGGGGYFFYDDKEVDDEWGVHYGVGAEFAGIWNLAARVEVGHMRLLDSGINMWTGSFLMYKKF